MADEVLIPIRGDESGLKSALNDSERTVNDFGVTIKRIFAGIGAYIAAQKIFELGKGFVEGFSEAQDAEQRLTQQLKATGEAAQQSKEDILARSAALMAMSKEDDDAITSLQALLLTFRNIKGEEFERATQAALDLSAALGEDLSSAGQKLGQALNAPDIAFRMLRTSGIAFTDAQEKAVKAMVEAGDVAGAQRKILNELEQSFGGAAEAAAGTFSGQLAQLKNRFGNLGEEIGSRIVPIIEKLFPIFDRIATFIGDTVVPAIDEAIDAFSEWAGEMQKRLQPSIDAITPTLEGLWETISTKLFPAIVNIAAKFVEWGIVVGAYLMPVMDGLIKVWTSFLIPIIEKLGGILMKLAGIMVDMVAPAFEFIFKVGTYIFTVLQTVIENAFDIMAAAVYGFALGVVKAFENIRHLLTKVVPAYLDWFGRNWKRVFDDIVSATQRVIENLSTNFKNLWTGLKSFFSGQGFTFDWTPLLAGFESTVEKLPEIAERVKGETELTLEQKLKTVTDRLSTSIQNSLQTNLRNNLGAINSALGNSGVNAPQFQEIAGEQESKRALRKKQFDEEKAASGGKSTIEDLVALNNRITAAAAGRGRTPGEDAIKGAVDKNKEAVEKQTAEQQRQHEESKQILRELKGIGGLT